MRQQSPDAKDTRKRKAPPLRDYSAKRFCLSCNEVFCSIGPGNRICMECDKEHEKERYLIGPGGYRYKSWEPV